MKKIYFTALLFSIITGFLHAQDDSSTLVRVGDSAPAFTCATIDGKTIDISKLNGKIILINFFATWCPPCLAELPELQKDIWEPYSDRSDFVLLIVGREHTQAEVEAFIEKKKFTMPFVPDPNREIFKLYATQNIPRNVVIGKDGKILFQSMGYSEEEFIKLKELLAKVLD